MCMRTAVCFCVCVDVCVCIKRKPLNRLSRLNLTCPAPFSGEHLGHTLKTAVQAGAPLYALWPWNSVRCRSQETSDVRASSHLSTSPPALHSNTHSGLPLSLSPSLPSLSRPGQPTRAAGVLVAPRSTTMKDISQSNKVACRLRRGTGRAVGSVPVLRSTGLRQKGPLQVFHWLKRKASKRNEFLC